MISDAELSDDEVVKQKLGTLTNGYTALFLTEDGFYEVLMQSRKPIAKSFKKEVKKILKELRIKGYLPAPAESDATIEIKRKDLEVLQLIRDLSNITIHTYSPDFIKRFKVFLTSNEAVAFDLLLRKYQGRI